MRTDVHVRLGQVVATPGALAYLGSVGVTAASLLYRHAKGDWGDLSADDKKCNDDALEPGNEARLLSAYQVGDEKVWVITEWDRSVTTVLMPDEY